MRTEFYLAMKSIEQERDRQEFLKASGKFRYTCADPHLTESEKLAVLAEEFGEVVREVVEYATLAYRERVQAEHGYRERVRAELAQVAAVCVAWIEALQAGDSQ